ncbi:MAG: Glu-tRNA(Gln) amidotransferase subunit GatE [Nanoarchaeota archaeon]|nr:Glu-tRNA(Gln) amidotransferase subunit GatE [Nanoarchaeota archaeon]
MTEERFDYAKLGLKCGLEIHQQIDTNKLFCNCPSVLRSEEPDFTVLRKLHAVAGQTGEVDEAAVYESELGKEFVYQGYDTTCLVELDEEPPHEINKDALKIALQVAVFLNCKIIPISQIMRKTVIDGSNTSGFQRTVVIAKNGWFDTPYGRVGIETIGLEEDAARIIEKREDEVVFRLDRLGIPLIEVATSPDMKTPEQAKEAALHIGEILRACKVKRGIGTIRQDVNISIKGGNRIEIKGVQEPALIIKTINSEIQRQLKLLENKEKIKKEVRQALPDGDTKFMRPMPGAARMYPETDLPLLKISRDLINDVKKSLPKLKSEKREELRTTGLNEEMMKLILDEDKLEEFKEMLIVANKPKLIAKMLLIFPKEISSHEGVEKETIGGRLNKDALIFVLEALEQGKIDENQVKQVLTRVAKGTLPRDAILFKKQDSSEIEEAIMKLIKEKSGLNANAYMGLVMKEFKGKISGKEAMEIILKYMK